MELMFPVSSGVQRRSEHEVRQETDWDGCAIIYHNVEHVLARRTVDELRLTSRTTQDKGVSTSIALLHHLQFNALEAYWRKQIVFPACQSDVRMIPQLTFPFK
jgi:hypothetical protein